MATRRYGINVGEVDTQITETVGAAVSSDSIELTVDLAGAGLTTPAGKEKVLLALKYFEMHILKGYWPPA